MFGPTFTPPEVQPLWGSKYRSSRERYDWRITIGRLGGKDGLKVLGGLFRDLGCLAGIVEPPFHSSALRFQEFGISEDSDTLHTLFGSMGKWYIYLPFAIKSQPTVGKYTITWYGIYVGFCDDFKVPLGEYPSSCFPTIPPILLHTITLY